MKAMLPYLGSSIEMEIFNDGTKEGDVLNLDCGADFVKVQQSSPKNMKDIRKERCVSVDGDADRVMYFYNDENGKFNMLDGDKIGTLGNVEIYVLKKQIFVIKLYFAVAGYIKELLSDVGLELNLGLVQTAYANGSSTKYITDKLVGQNY